MNQNNNNEIITKKDYQILGVKEESTVHEIKLAHQKLSLQYHPAIIRKKEGREPNELELKRFQEIEKVYKKFDFEPEMYVCCGVKEGVKFCLNTFYLAL
jgi:preprotein translocase subunit Sec63